MTDDRRGLPKSVKVGFMDVPILITMEADDHRNSGEFHPRTHVIKIRPSLCDAELAAVLLHEIFHAYNRLFASWTHEKLDEEYICELASHTLLTLWRDNPALMAWIDSVVMKNKKPAGAGEE